MLKNLIELQQSHVQVPLLKSGKIIMTLLY